MARWSLTGARPDWFPSDKQRYIIATNEGWVYEYRYTTDNGNSKVHRELLVSIAGLADSSGMGAPSIAELYVANSSGGTSIRKNNAAKVYVVWDEPLDGVATNWTLAVANTDAGASKTGTAGATIYNANNTVGFAFTPTAKGRYKIQGQTISNTTDALLSHNPGGEAVSKLISDAVSNALGYFWVVDGSPVVKDIAVSNSTGGTSLKKDDLSSIIVYYDEPITGDPRGWTLNVANTASGNTVVATGSAIYGDHAIKFDFYAANTGTYKVQGQTIANTNDYVLSSAPGGVSVARLIQDATSNALGTFSIA